MTVLEIEQNLWYSHKNIKVMLLDMSVFSIIGGCPTVEMT